jgi:hypothetical protein
VAVEVAAGAVVAHGGAPIGVAGGDLHVAQAHAGVQHGGHDMCLIMCGWIFGMRVFVTVARWRCLRVAA